MMEENSELEKEMWAVKDRIEAIEGFYEEMTDKAKQEYELLQKSREVIDR